MTPAEQEILGRIIRKGVTRGVLVAGIWLTLLNAGLVFAVLKLVELT